MAQAAKSNGKTSPPTTYERAAELLGGQRLLRLPVHTKLDAHALLTERRLPGESLANLLDSRVLLPQDDLLRATGVSLRTIQRRTAGPKRASAKGSAASSPASLNPEQSGRVWKLAEVIARAMEVFGTREAAEKWLGEPARGLERRRPIDLLQSPVGTEMVEELLGRMEYGVYT
jgi:putative toxin-antitoxin system antitoxin component (TIGR02293 family)